MFAESTTEYPLESLNCAHNETSTQWFLSVLQACIDGAWYWEIEKNYEKIYISALLKTRLGYTEDEKIGETKNWWMQHVYADDLEKLKNFWKNCLHNPVTSRSALEFRVRHSNGHYLWLLLTSFLEKDKNNKLIRAGGAFTDISSYRILQTQLEHTIEEAETISQGKSSFIASLNHELRTPLNGILGMISLLRETPLTENQNRYANTIQNSADLMLTLVNDILDVSKIAAGKLELEESSFSLSEAINSIVDLVKPSAEKKGLTFKTLIESGLPEYFLGDKTRFQQVIINLMNNAVKFTDTGSIRLNVLIKEKKDQEYSILFEIIDTGMGIREENLEKLFSDFTQASASITRTHGGTGLGLSICKKLVSLMKGKIGVTSVVGQGTTFWFEIPFIEAELSKEVSPPDLPQPSLYQPPVSSITTNRLRILLVEDNRVNQEVMLGLLAKLGDEVDLANNGLEAVEAVAKKEFDLILMDINMPIMDGLTAARKIREMEAYKDIPIIAVTANTLIADQDNCMTSVMNKPVNKGMIEALLAPYRKQRSPSIEEAKMAAPSASFSNNSQEEVHLMNYKIINSETVEELISDLGQPTLIRLFGIYQKDAESLLTQLHEMSNPTDIHNLSHTLAGMSENLGVVEIGKTARVLMTLSERDPTKIKEIIPHLEKQFDVALQEINHLLSNT